MSEEKKPYHVSTETPVTEWKSKIGYQIARLVACDAPRCNKLAFESLTEQLEVMAEKFVLKYEHFKEKGRPEMTEEELELLFDAACYINDIWTDLCHAQIKYHELDRLNAQNKKYVPAGKQVDELFSAFAHVIRLIPSTQNAGLYHNRDVD